MDNLTLATLSLLQVSTILLCPLYFAMLGRNILSLGFWCASKTEFLAEFTNQQKTRSYLAFFIIGALCFFYLVLMLKSLGLSWLPTLLLALAPCFISLRSFVVWARQFRLSLSFNYVLWLLVTLVLGISLFDGLSDIGTIWVNNYADLSFHYGMIASFALSENFPPKYHIFAGSTLSYPFFINLWSASAWWINPTPNALARIFTIQWTLLWSIVYFAVRNKSYPLLPWAILFGGGSLTYLLNYMNNSDSYEQLGLLSHSFIDKGLPWTVFISTIWVTQRAALLGLSCILVALDLFYYSQRHSNKLVLIIAGLILGLSPLAHTHFFLAAFGFILIFLTIKALNCNKTVIIEFFYFLLSLFPVGLATPWLIGKSHILDFIPGWMNQERILSSQISHFGLFWLKNAAPVFLFALLIWIVSKQHRAILSLSLLFLLFNIVQLAFWPWDQIKLFVALYVILLSLVSFKSHSLSAMKRYSITALMFVLMVPALLETGRVLFKLQRHTIFSSSDITLARDIIQITPKNAIIFSSPNVHNGAANLTGRAQYVGYNGWLYSHGVNYLERENQSKESGFPLNCSEEPNCPDYLIWGEAERKILHSNLVAQLQVTSNPQLYLIHK